MSRRTFRRTATLSVPALALAIAGCGVIGPAPPRPQSVIIQYGNDACGGLILGAPIIGTASFQQSGNQLSVDYSIYAGEPNTEYEVTVHDGDTCAQIGPSLGTFTTDGSGGGSLQGDVDVTGHTVVYATGFADLFGGLPNNSLEVTLG